jgi:uncharacterized Zn finger protein
MNKNASADPFASLITEAELERLAGARSYARGMAYFRSGAVLDLVRTRGALKARVLGSEEYRVALRAPGRALEWSCTCPLGDEGAFCKHAVAAGLAWLHGERSPQDELAPLHPHLASRSKEALVELILEQASEDPELRTRLESAAMREAAPADPKALKEAVRRAFAVRGFVDYRGMRAFVARAESIAHLLRERLEGGGAAVLEIADYAMRRGLAAYERVDDSDGGFGALLHEIAALHLDAVRAARPEGEAPGAALFELQMLDQWGFFDIADYAPLFDAKGLARYRALAESAWRGVPELAPGSRREPDTRRIVLAHLMEALARLDGDADTLVAVKRRDLSAPHAFLDIAEVLAAAKRHDEALAWAERGRKAFPKNPDPRLTAFLVAAYRRARRNGDAAALAWEHFAREPGLDAWKLLRSACAAGDWPASRDKALVHLRTEPKDNAQRRFWRQDRSRLVEILLHEGDSDAALAEARSGGCSEALWMSLAAAREASHPAEAAEIYRARIEPIVSRTNNAAYDEAAKLAARIRALMKRAGKEKECAEWLDTLRARHKAKRNFMQRLGAGAPK